MRELDNYFNYLKNKLSDYEIIFTPFDLTNPAKDATLIYLNGIDYTYDQIIEAISLQKEII
jgi:hypothetical protein